MRSARAWVIRMRQLAVRQETVVSIHEETFAVGKLHLIMIAVVASRSFRQTRLEDII